MFIIHLWSILKQFRERKHFILLRVVELITFIPLSFGCSGIWGGLKRERGPVVWDDWRHNFMQPYERKYSILKVADLILCTAAITFSFGVSFQLNSYATMFISIGLIGLVYHQCAAVSDSLSDLHVGMHYNDVSQVSWRLNHQELDGVFSILTRQTSKNTWSLLITGLLRGETVTKS